MAAEPKRSTDATALGALAPRERIVAIADAESVQPLDAWFEAPRPSPHLARWGIRARDDDGVVILRARLHGAPLLIAAQDGRFLGGSVGARHADALHRMFALAMDERPSAVVILAASAGVRLHEANPAELGLARALAALLDARAAGIPVIAVGVADTFGGASVFACAAERTALLPGVRLGLSGPAVIETARGRDEVDSQDTDALLALFGAEARARAGHVELVADDASVVREWIARCVRETVPFASWVATTQARLGARLQTGAGAAAPPTSMSGSGASPLQESPLQESPLQESPLQESPLQESPLQESPVSESPPRESPPQESPVLCAGAEPVDGAGWLWRMRDRPLWLTRRCGRQTFGPREAHALDSALLLHLGVVEAAVDGIAHSAADGATHGTADRVPDRHSKDVPGRAVQGAGAPALFLVDDSLGHEASRDAEAMCASQYLAQHAAVIALLRARGVRVRGLIAGIGHSAALFCNALQAPQVYAIATAKVVAMEPAAIARVTRLPQSEVAALIDDDPLFGHPVRHFASWGGVAQIVDGIDCDTLSRLAERNVQTLC